MSRPFFIWTMRRTGGTSLASMLMEMSEYNGVQHEPFNLDRKYGYVIKEFRDNRDDDRLTNKLDNIFDSYPLIKHCYELFGTEFNDLILKSIGKKEPYRHLFLKREDEVSRIMSLYLAFQSEVWGVESTSKYQSIINGEKKLEPFPIDNMKKHLFWCNRITEHIKCKLTENGNEYIEISFEDIYDGDREERLRRLDKLFDYLEFDQDIRDNFSDVIEEKIFNSSQKSKSVIELVPNYEETKEVLSSTLEKLSC